MNSPDPAVDLPVNLSSYTLRNRGPWTTVEYLHWPDFSVGHTTALSAGAGIDFQDGNQIEILTSLDFPSRQHHAEQVHGGNCSEVSGPSACHRGVDGLVQTDSPDGLLSLFLRTADCLPVYIKTTDGSDQIALVHAGWRGLISQVVPRVLNFFSDQPVEVFVGPHIPTKNYEVGPEVIQAVEECLSLSEGELIERGLLTDDDHLDLFHILLVQLARWRGTIQGIWRSPLTTTGSDPVPLISYRREPTEDRLVHWFYPRHVENGGNHDR